MRVDDSSRRRTSQENEDLYAILEINKDATTADIKRAYRRLALKYHPDKNPEDPLAAERFKEVNRAHAVLSDPNKRKIYDQYGSFGLYLAEQLDEETLDTYFALQNPCVKCCLGTLFFLSCACCCFCCFCCCDFCCGRCRPNTESEDINDLLDEIDQHRQNAGSNGEEKDEPVVSQPGATPVPIVIPTDDSALLSEVKTEKQ